MQLRVSLPQVFVVRRERLTGGHALGLGDGEGVLDLPDGGEQHLQFVIVELHQVGYHIRKYKTRQARICFQSMSAAIFRPISTRVGMADRSASSMSLGKSGLKFCMTLGHWRLTAASTQSPDES